MSRLRTTRKIRRNKGYRRLRSEQLERRMLLASDPGFSFVDADNDALFTAGTDVALIAGELDDGFFDTDVAEGGYNPPIPGAGLYIGGDPIVAFNLDFSADGLVTVNTDLTATNQNLLLTSRFDSVKLDDPTLHARNLLEINAAVDIVSSDDVLRASGSESVIRLDAGNNILLTGTRVTAMKEVEMDAGTVIFINDSANPAVVSATPNVLGKVDLAAGLRIDVSGAQIDATRDIILDAAADDVAAVGSQLTADQNGMGKVEIIAFNEVEVQNSVINARKEVVIVSEASFVFAQSATIQAVPVGNSTVGIQADGFIGADNATLSAAQTVAIVSISGNISAPDSTLTATPNLFGRVALVALGAIDVDRATITAQLAVNINAESDVTGVGATMTASGSNGFVQLEVGGAIDVSGADTSIFARKNVRILGSTDIDVSSATIQAAAAGESDVSIRAVAGSVDAALITLAASATVSVSAGADINADFATLTAVPHYLGKVDLDADGSIELNFATIEATKDIEIDAGFTLNAFDVTMTSSGHSQSRIDLHAGVFIEAPFSNIFARRQIVMRADADDVSVAFSTVKTSTVGDASIELDAGDIVNGIGATVEAAASVVATGNLINFADATLTATPHYLGKVDLDGDTVDVPRATITATKEIDIDAAFNLLGTDAVMNANGHSDGTIDLDAGGDMGLDGAILNARELVELEAVDSIFAAGAKLLAQGDVFSRVRAIAGVDLLLTDAVIRAREEISLLASGVVDLTRASVGITHLGPGDLIVCGSTIIVTDATLVDPDGPAFCVPPVGSPTFIGIGFLPSVSC